MISSADVPACPACGSREVHPVQGRDDRTLYACRQCGRDNSEAWRNIQPPREPKPVIGAPEPFIPTPDKETIHAAAMRLGICAELKT
jgi:DNA-directed RNA polymerase subunit RPC12/RpoP